MSRCQLSTYEGDLHAVTTGGRHPGGPFIFGGPAPAFPAPPWAPGTETGTQNDEGDLPAGRGIRRERWLTRVAGGPLPGDQVGGRRKPTPGTRT